LEVGKDAEGMHSLFTAVPFGGFGSNRYSPFATAEATEQIQGDGRVALRRAVKARCPPRPGIYAMLDGQGEIIYIGKAKKLRTRLLNYFRKSSSEKYKARRLLRRTQTIVWEYAPNEFAALLRELELIQRFRPRFNVMGQPFLRRRAYVCIGRAPAPFVYVVREPPGKAVTWFGPLIARVEVYEAVRHLNDLFQLRDCPKKVEMHFADQQLLLSDGPRTAGCIRHEMGTCLGPCAGLCSTGRYRQRVQAARRFLRCDDGDTLQRLRQEMEQAAIDQEYERAGVLRDKVQSLEWLLGSLGRLRLTREELSFIYPVLSFGSAQQLWYLIHEGQIRLTVMPSESGTSASCAKELKEKIEEIYTAPPRVGIPLEAIDHVWLIAAWFRKFPQERERCLSVKDILKN
jgi:excinuclease ABC subunit C